MDSPGLEDPLWEYILQSRLKIYLPKVREWWANISTLTPQFDTGVALITNDPPGLYYRFTRTAVRSPIKGIQAFPFIPTSYLQMTGIKGGSTKMVEHVCAQGLRMEEFTILCKSNLPSINNQGQFLVLIPTDIYTGSKHIGKWVYLTCEELKDLANSKVLKTVRDKALLKIEN